MGNKKQTAATETTEVDPVDALDMVRYARSGRDRGRRVDEIVDEVTNTKGTVHMVKGDGEFRGARFYGKVGDMETEAHADVNVVTDWVRRQLKRSREIQWRRMLRVRYSRAGTATDGEGRFARRRDFDGPDHEGKVEIELQVEVLMIGFHEGAGWRELSVAQFEDTRVEDKLKVSQKASLPSARGDLSFPYRPQDGGYYSERNWLWTDYDDGLFQALRAIQDVIVNARKQVAKLLGDDDATLRLATLGAAAIPKLIGAGESK